MQHSRFLVAAIVAATFAIPAQAQTTIAQRVARAPDGAVHLRFSGRSGTCGDGRDMIGYRNAIFMESLQSFGDWNAPRCVPGPVRVSLTVADGRVTQMRTFVGGDWSRTSARVTDLGAVSSSEAAAFFFGLVPQLEGRSDKGRLLLPAVLADDAGTVPRLISLARNEARAQSTKREAIQWVGLLGDASVIPTLVEFANTAGDAPRDGDIDDDDEKLGKVGKKGLATAAIAALSFLENGVGIPALIDLARNGGTAVRHSAVFWLGQSGDPRAIAVLHTVIENEREDERIRGHAIFSLARGDETPEKEFAYLRGMFSRLTSERLKKAILHAMSQDPANGSPWLLEKARDRGEPMRIRKNAVFWAGQRQATPTRDLVAFYRGAEDSDMREHVIFVLSQRNDEVALDELLRIAREDDDRRMRGKAMFWLGQKDDPRVANLINERLAR